MPKGGLISGIFSADALVHTTWGRDIRESGARPKKSANQAWRHRNPELGVGVTNRMYTMTPRAQTVISSAPPPPHPEAKGKAQTKKIHWDPCGS